MRAVPCGAMDDQQAEQLDDDAARPVEDEEPRKSRGGTIWAVAVVLALAAVIGYVSIRANSGSKPSPARAATCAEWADKGSANKVIQAREMLTALRQQDGLGAPETPAAQQFANGLTSLCASSGDSARLAELAAGLYVTQR
jgi:hypothetical protein